MSHAIVNPVRLRADEVTKDGSAVGVIFQIRVSACRTAARPDADELLRFRASDGTYFAPECELRALRARGRAFDVLRRISEEELPVRFVLPHEGAVNDPPPEEARLTVLARLLAEQRADGDVNVRFLGRHRTVPPDGFVLDRAGGGRRYVWQIVPAQSGDSLPDPAQRFCAVRTRLHDPAARVVLALGSGGLKLFSHAPALRLMERIGCANAIDEVWGTSAGALVALLYCHGLSPEAIEQTGYDLYGGRYQLELRPSTLRVLREILREALLPSRGPADAGFVDCAAGLSRMIDEYCSEIRSTRPLYVIAFNLETGRSEVLTPEPVPTHLCDFIVQTDAREAALASCAVPLLFVPRRIRRDDHEVAYIDGSTTEDVPLRSVVRKWDRDRAAGVETRKRLVIVYVKLSQGGLAYPTTAGARGGKLRLLQTVASAGMETIHARDLELIAQRSDVELIPLRLPEPDAAFFEISRIPEYIRRAKESFALQLEELERELRRAQELPYEGGPRVRREAS